MPIKLENKHRYPPDWQEIVERVRERSGNRCEFEVDGERCTAINGRPHPITHAKVVLTVAHLDHIPEHCALSNLRHACQKCHNKYDAPHRQHTKKATREADMNRNQLQLFGG